MKRSKTKSMLKNEKLEEELSRMKKVGGGEIVKNENSEEKSSHPGDLARGSLFFPE
jgi:hypothetical protein